jgi:hypothetical protein
MWPIIPAEPKCCFIKSDRVRRLKIERGPNISMIRARILDSFGERNGLPETEKLRQYLLFRFSKPAFHAQP